MPIIDILLLMPAPEPFFREVENWRGILAGEIAAKNEIPLSHVNLGVTRILCGLLFLKIAGVRRVGESFDVLTEGSDIYARLLLLFGDGEQGLPNLVVGDEALRSILDGLCLFEIPCHAEFLGRVYERLGNDSDARKADGIFYTPPYIVETIVARTLGPLMEGRTPFDAHKVALLDPACGCGWFLLGACDWLFEWHRDWYLTHDVSIYLHKEEEEWRLRPEERARIVRDHLYGVDIDGGAVEVARLSLRLKVLGADDTVFSFRDNIKCGNSLIGDDFGSPLSFDWSTEFSSIMAVGGFDAVIGNPPYSNYSSRDSLRAFYVRSGQSVELDALNRAIEYCALKYADCSVGCKDLYKWFTARALELTRPGGYLGFITPNTWLTQPKYRDLKRKVFAASGDIEIIDLGLGVFPVVVPTCIVIARKGAGNLKRHADLRGIKDKVAALDGCVFQELPDDGRVGEPPLVKRYLEEWPAELKLKQWLTLREGQHIPRAELVKGQPKGSIPVIDSKNMGRYEFDWNPRFSFAPQGCYRTTQGKRLVVRKTGDAIVATLTPADEAFVLQSLYQGVYIEASLAPEYLLGLLNSRFLTFIYQNSQHGQKGRVLAQFRKAHLDDLPLPQFDLDRHDRLVELVLARLHGAANEVQINALVYELYGLNDEEIALVERSSE